MVTFLKDMDGSYGKINTKNIVLVPSNMDVFALRSSRIFPVWPKDSKYPLNTTASSG